MNAMRKYLVKSFKETPHEKVLMLFMDGPKEPDRMSSIKSFVPDE
jgi:hypothetical protein